MLLKSSLTLSLLIFLGFFSSSVLFSSLVVPSTRSLKSTEEDPQSSSSPVQDFLTHQVEDAMDLKEGEDVVNFRKMFITNGRMDLESLDYQGTGANNHHDPKTPGRA